MATKTTNRERAAHLNEIADMFDSLPKNALNQAIGGLEALTPEVLISNDKGECDACVGAWLAVHFKVIRPEGLINGFPSSAHYFFSDGADALASYLAISRDELGWLLYEYGAPATPFGMMKWQTPPAEVFRRFAAAVEGGQLG